MADQILVTKCDGDLVQAARNTQYEYTTALRLLQPKNVSWTPKVILCSARSGEGIQAIWENMEMFRDSMQVRSLADSLPIVINQIIRFILKYLCISLSPEKWRIE